MAFLEVNGVALPMPKRGLEIIISTAVNSGRNAQAEVIGERVGRDVLKYNSLEWAWLSAEQWTLICSVFSNFFAVAKIWNPATGSFVSVKVYPGDRSGKPYWLTPDASAPAYLTECKVNIIDCGIL